MKLRDLLQNPLNRKIDRAKVAEIKRAIKISGVIKPLVYTEVMTDKGKENMLTDGHHRYVALKEMGYKRAPAVMADERGIDTANQAKPESVKKAERSCKKGYYRDKNGKCRRRANYGLIYFPGRHKKPHNHNGNGETPPSNGNGGMTPTATNKATIEVLRNLAKLVRKHGTHDQSTHAPEPQARRQEVAQFSRQRLRESGKFKDLRRRLQSLAAQSAMGLPGAKERLEATQQQLADMAAEMRREMRSETKKFDKHGSHNQQDHDPTKGKGKKTPQARGKALRAQLRPAIRTEGITFIGRKGQLHFEVMLDNQDDPGYGPGEELGFADAKGNFLTRDEASRRAGISTSEELNEKKVVKGVNILRELLSKLNRLTKEGVASTPVSGLELTREDLQDEMSHPHPGHVKKQDTSEALRDVQEKIYKRLKRGVRKHTPGGQQHDQQTHGRKKISVTDSLIMSIRPAVKNQGQIYSGEQGQLHADVEEQNGLDDFQERGFVDRRGNWMEREEVGAIIGGEGLSEDLVDAQEGLNPAKVTKHAQHDQSTHDPTRGKGKGKSRSTTAGKSGFVTAFHNRTGAYVEVFQNPSKRELHNVDSWKDQDAVRAMLTESGDLIYWDSRALHHEVRDILHSKEEVVPLLIGENYLYVTDNVKNSFEGSTSVNTDDFYDKVRASSKIINRHKDKLAALIGEFEIDHYGSGIEGNVAKQPYKKIRKAKNHWLSLIGQDRDKVMKLAREIAKAQKRKGWATQPGFRLNQKMDMSEGVNTKRPYKNPDGANIESARNP